MESKVVGIAHVAVATHSIEASLDFYRGLGLELEAQENHDGYELRAAMIRVGGSQIELLEPTGSASPIRTFLDTRGPGIHHIAFHVDDLSVTLSQLKARGVRLIDEEPRPGVEGSRVAFVHPKAAGGVLIELVELTDEGEK